MKNPDMHKLTIIVSEANTSEYIFITIEVELNENEDLWSMLTELSEVGIFDYKTNIYYPPHKIEKIIVNDGEIL